MEWFFRIVFYGKIFYYKVVRNKIVYDLQLIKNLIQTTFFAFNRSKMNLSLELWLFEIFNKLIFLCFVLIYLWSNNFFFLN